MAKSVRAPDGTTWRVGRRFLPWRLRWRGGPKEVLDAVDATELLGVLDDGIFVAVGVVLAVIAFLVLATFFVLPLIVLTVEVALALFIVGLVFAWRIVFRKPWLVTAAVNRTVHRQWKRVGWRASGHLVEQVASSIERGQPLPF